MKNVNYIGYCGLYCAECFLQKGSVANLARDLRKELRSVKFENTAAALSELSFFKSFENYETCYDVLGNMVKLRCNKTCREGGGNPYCKIRKCCRKKGFSGCWECEIFENCDKMNELSKSHGIAHITNLRIIKKKGIDGFLSGKKHWYVKE